MTCHCYMCGSKRPGKVGRSSYIRAGIVTSESGETVKGTGRKYARRLRRVREQRTWQSEYGRKGVTNVH